MDRSQVGVQVLRLLLDIEQTGDDLTLRGMMLEEAESCSTVVQLVVGRKLAQRKLGAVVLFYNLDCSGLVFNLDRHAAGYEIEPVHGLVMLAHEIEALGRTSVIVEGNTGRNHIDKCRAPMGDCRLDDRNQLMLVAREGARDKACAQLQRH